MERRKRIAAMNWIVGESTGKYKFMQYISSFAEMS